MIFTIKCIVNDFYNKNALEMIFTIKIHCKWFLLKKYIAKLLTKHKTLKQTNKLFTIFYTV